MFTSYSELILLAWTEQTSIFQYFGNLTFNSFPLYYIISLSIILIFIFKWDFNWNSSVDCFIWAVIMKIRDWLQLFFQFHLHF
jgi:hypothetical protein